MGAKYFPGLFKSRYPCHGKAWVRDLAPDDLKVFVDIGNQANDHGRKGGRALTEKRGRSHMSQIGRIGAIMSNIRQGWIKATREERMRLGLED